MKIILATPIYPPDIGGPAQYAVELPQKLAPAHEVITIAYGGEESGQQTKFVAKTQPLAWRLWKFGQLVYQHGKTADVIYAQNAVAAGLPAVLVGKILGKPVIIKVVGDEAWERAFGSGQTKKLISDFLPDPEGGFKIRILMMIQKFVLKNATTVTTPSQYLGELIRDTYGLEESKVRTNYNAAEINVSNPSSPKLEFQIATAVRLVKWKNVAGIIEAIHKLRSKYPRLHLKIAGSGPESHQLQQLTDSLNLKSHVTFLGEISREETIKLFAESAATVLNSNYEGLPFGVLMSFAVGTPAIATDIPGTNEVIENEVNGLLVKPQNQDELAEAIDKVLSANNLTKKLSEGGRTALQGKFSWETHVNNLETIFNSVKKV